MIKKPLLEPLSHTSSNVSWGNGIGSSTALYGTQGTFDELRLGAFKQRVISAFSTI